MPKKVSSHSEEHVQPTLASVPVEIDPAAKGTPIRYALVIEAVLNVLGATWMVIFPENFLNLIVTKPSDIRQPPSPSPSNLVLRICPHATCPRYSKHSSRN